MSRYYVNLFSPHSGLWTLSQCRRTVQADHQWKVQPIYVQDWFQGCHIMTYSHSPFQFHTYMYNTGGCTWCAVCTLLELSMWNRVFLVVSPWTTSPRLSGALSRASSVRWNSTIRQGSASAATLDSARVSSMSLGKQTFIFRGTVLFLNNDHNNF